MATEQMLLRLPEELVHAFRRRVPERQRSAYVSALLEKALAIETEDDDPLYRAALAAEQDAGLMADMADWETATVGDGLDDGGPRHAKP